MVNIAYTRVSTLLQHEARQTEALEKFSIDKWFVEKISAKDTNRPQFQAMLDYARKGDTIYVLSLDRLCRSLLDLLQTTKALQERGINLVSLKENIDMSTPTGRLMLAFIGAICEFERANILERQREGIEIAKRLGKYKGRHKIKLPDNWHEYFLMHERKELKAGDLMKHFGLKKDTFYKFVHDSQKELYSAEKSTDA